MIASFKESLLRMLLGWRRKRIEPMKLNLIDDHTGPTRSASDAEIIILI
jgi:hypothetical protein